MSVPRRTVLAIAAATATAAAPFIPRFAAGLLTGAAFAAGGDTHGMKRYADAAYRFSFWYPAALRVTASKASDDKSFPGGVVVETLQVGPPGGASLHVVDSPTSTITDEPNGHASPIAQTRYFYDSATRRWMVAYPEGTDSGNGSATAAADVSKKTIGGLPMLPSGARFDTTIIPLSITRFIVVQDGGGSAFTNELARTVAPAGAGVDPAALSAALKAEAAAYGKQ